MIVIRRRARLAVMGVDRAMLFRLATSERLERVVKAAPCGDAQAWRAASRYVAGRSRDEALIATVDLLGQGHGSVSTCSVSW